MRICFSVNCFLSSIILQGSRLRQGDPPLPILFNLMFKSLLRRILHHGKLGGFSVPCSLAAPQDAPNLSAIKILTYADDVVCLLQDRLDLAILQSHLNTYSLASNAKVNFHKTQAMSLSSACTLPEWQDTLIKYSIFK